MKLPAAPFKPAVEEHFVIKIEDDEDEILGKTYPNVIFI